MAACFGSAWALPSRLRKHVGPLLLKGEFGLKASSSIGRAAVSKTAGWGFDSLLACHLRHLMARNNVRWRRQM